MFRKRQMHSSECCHYVFVVICFVRYFVSIGAFVIELGHISYFSCDCSAKLTPLHEFVQLSSGPRIFDIKIIKLMFILIGLEVIATGKASKCHLQVHSQEGNIA